MLPSYQSILSRLVTVLTFGEETCSIVEGPASVYNSWDLFPEYSLTSVFPGSKA